MMQIRKIIQNKAQRNKKNGKYRGKGKNIQHRMKDSTVCQSPRRVLIEDEIGIIWREKG